MPIKEVASLFWKLRKSKLVERMPEEDWVIFGCRGNGQVTKKWNIKFYTRLKKVPGTDEYIKRKECKVVCNDFNTLDRILNADFEKTNRPVITIDDSG